MEMKIYCGSCFLEPVKCADGKYRWCVKDFLEPDEITTTQNDIVEVVETADNEYDLFKNYPKDINGVPLKENQNVIWIDPDKNARDLNRVYKVWRVTEDIIYIADSYSSAEVYPDELEIIDDAINVQNS